MAFGAYGRRSATLKNVHLGGLKRQETLLSNMLPLRRFFDKTANRPRSERHHPAWHLPRKIVRVFLLRSNHEQIRARDIDWRTVRAWDVAVTDRPGRGFISHILEQFLLIGIC